MTRPAAALAAVAALFAIASLAPTSTARAQTYSPSISPASVAIESLLAPGVTHDLPPLAVRNEGDAAIEVVMSASPRDDGSPTDALDWVAFTPETFTLAAGATRTVAVRMAVPATAALGGRSVWLRAAVTPPVDPGGVALSVGVAVASGLTFEVGNPTDAARDGGGFAPGLRSQWPAGLAALAAGAVAYLLSAFAGRYRLRVGIERRGGREDGEAERVDRDQRSP